LQLHLLSLLFSSLGEFVIALVVFFIKVSNIELLP
jgi:hypothetical protein